MIDRKSVVAGIVLLMVGFAGGFVLRPVLMPSEGAVPAISPTAPTFSEARGIQYFVAHVVEARRVVAGCRDGSVRGAECAIAAEAIIKVEAQERRKRFLGK